jgi:ABC-type multidrug transport system ATPase subunit
MRPSGGTLRVMGIDARRRPGAVRALVALGLFAGLNDLAEPLTVSDTVRAELALRGTTPTRERVAAVPAALDLPLDGKERVGDLTMGGRATLGVALALVAKPRVLVVDDMDADLDPDERATLRDVLRRVADTGITVIGSCIDPASARFADVVVPMASWTGSEVPAHAFAQSR